MFGLPTLMDVHCYLEAPAATRVTLLASCCTFHVGAEPPAGWPPTAAAPPLVECARRVARWAVANLPAAAGMAEDELVQAQVCGLAQPGRAVGTAKSHQQSTCVFRPHRDKDTECPITCCVRAHRGTELSEERVSLLRRHPSAPHGRLRFARRGCSRSTAITWASCRGQRCTPQVASCRTAASKPTPSTTSMRPRAWASTTPFVTSSRCAARSPKPIRRVSSTDARRPWGPYQSSETPMDGPDTQCEACLLHPSARTLTRAPIILTNPDRHTQAH
jgi:hypothetical protein